MSEARQKNLVDQIHVLEGPPWGELSMNGAANLESFLLRQNVVVNPATHEDRCPPIEPNHYAVIALDPAGREMCGWDFKLLAVAKAFADRVRQKHLRLEIWAQDEFGRALGRRVAGIHNVQWIETSDTEVKLASHEMNKRSTRRDQVRGLQPA
jgi:hypothetical protein